MVGKWVAGMADQLVVLSECRTADRWADRWEPPKADSSAVLKAGATAGCLGHRSADLSDVRRAGEWAKSSAGS